MMDKLLTLKKGEISYPLSDLNRSYNRFPIFEGEISRAVTGKLNICQTALKTGHTVTWALLSYDEALDGGIGLKVLEALVMSGEIYTLEVNRDPSSGDPVETFEVMFDPSRFTQAPVPGLARKAWQVSVTMLEV